MGKGGLVWNFLCDSIGSFIYDRSGSGFTKVKILVSTIKAAPRWSSFLGGGGFGKIHTHTKCLLRPIYFNTSEEER